MHIFNKRAKRNYKILETITAGIVLTGEEVKSARTNKVNLDQSFAKIINNEVFLINAVITTKNQQSKSKKLLLNKKEIISLKTKIKSHNLTLIPLKMYTRGPLIKLEIGLGKTKRKFEKRESLKKRDIQRDIERELKIKGDDTRI